MRRRAVLLLVTVWTVSCSDSVEPPGPPVALQYVSGNGQSGIVGQPLPEPLRVRVVDVSGRSVAGVPVTFSASQGDLTLFALSPAAGLRTSAVALDAEVMSDATGEAEAVWTLGGVAGEQAAVARVAGLDSLTFSATATPDAPALLVVAGGDGQLDLPGATLASPLVVRVVDQYFNPLEGLAVSWTVVSGAGSITQASGETGVTGETSTVLTLGDSAGYNTVRAAYGALAPLDFNALGLTAVWVDALGDTFSAGYSTNYVLPDLVRLGVDWTDDSLHVGLAFADSVASRLVGGPNVMAGLMYLDIDMDSLTPGASSADEYGPGSLSTGIGVDVILDMFGDPSGYYVLFNPAQQILGTVIPDMRGRLVSFYLPKSVIGGGPLAMEVVVGTPAEPTDIAPNDGSIVVDAGGGSAVAMRANRERASAPTRRAWGPFAW